MRKISILFTVLLIASSAFAQLTDWEFKRDIRVVNRYDTALTNHQVLITLNTAELISAGKMQPDGADLRVVSDCETNTPLTFFIDEGINTTATKIWVLMPTLAGNADTFIQLYYGNPAAATASDFAGTFPNRVIVVGDTAIEDFSGIDWFEVRAGGSVTPTGNNSPLTITAQKVLINGDLNCDNLGEFGEDVFGPAQSPCGTGAGATYSGGGYGGRGGNIAGGGGGGSACGSNNTDTILVGSGGGSDQFTAGGSGGGSVFIQATDIVVTGNISVNGENGGNASGAGATNGGGGGSGGGVLFISQQVDFSSTTISAQGGQGGIGSQNGGGGGGGRIKMFHETVYNPGTMNVMGGTGPGASENGQNGTIYEEQSTLNSRPITTINGEVVSNFARTTIDTTFCSGTELTISIPAVFDSIFLNLNGDVTLLNGNTYTTNNLPRGLNTVFLTGKNINNPCISTTDTFNASFFGRFSDATQDQTVCSGEIALLRVASVEGNLQWQKKNEDQDFTDISPGGTASAIQNRVFKNSEFRAIITDDICIDTTNTVFVIAAINGDTLIVDTICDGESVTHLGVTYDETGVYFDTTTTEEGCDVRLELNLTVLESDIVRDTQTICAGDTAFYRDTFTTVAGTFGDTFVKANGCDSSFITTVFVNPSPNQTPTVFICPGDSIFLEGEFQNMEGTYFDTFTTVNGCDSIVTTELIIDDTIRTFDTATICNGDSVFLAGAFRKTAGDFSDTNQASFGPGYDSISFAHIIVNEPSADGETVKLCPGDSVFAGGAFQKSTGTYTDTFTNSVGCDSVFTTEVINGFTSSSTEEVIICPHDSLFLGGVWVRQRNRVFRDTIFGGNADGCDSFRAVIITAYYDTTITNINAEICEGDTFILEGEEFFTDGIHFYHYIDETADGCDSTIRINLTVTPGPRGFDEDTICAGDTATIGGMQYTESGSYQKEVIEDGASDGCDSFVNVNLFVRPYERGTNIVTLCFGDSIEINDTFRTEAGIYEGDTIEGVASFGCDSIVDIDLRFFDQSINELDTFFCSGDSITIGDSTYTEESIRDTVLSGQGANGCDSTISIFIRFFPIESDTIQGFICDDGSFTFRGMTYSDTGLFADTVEGVTADGCDSVYFLDLDFFPTAFGDTIDTFICNHDSLFVGGRFQSDTGIYQDTLVDQSSNGCDSIRFVRINYFEIASDTVPQFFCFGDTVILFGTDTVTMPGVYEDTLTKASAEGCDSIYAIDLQYFEVPSDTTDTLICSRDTIILFGDTITAEGVYSDTLEGASQNGCDSLAAFNVIFRTIASDTIDTLICAGDSLFIGGSQRSDTGIYADTLLNASEEGCDSIRFIRLQYFFVASDTIDTTICAGDSIFAGGEQRFDEGIYADTLIGASEQGCDSVRFFNVNHFIVLSDTIPLTLCAEDTLFTADSFFVRAGIHPSVLRSASEEGCDSTFFINLTYFEVERDTLLDTICEADTFFYGNNGKFATETGLYSDTIFNVTNEGCDSIVEFSLLVLEREVEDSIRFICEGDSIFLAGSFRTDEGLYVDTIVGGSANGCDRFIRYDLFLHERPVRRIRRTICEGDSLFVGGDFQTQPGEYFDTIANATVNGCDSIVHTTLRFSPIVQTFDTINICFGDSVEIFGTFYSVGVTVSDTTSSQVGLNCDSISTITLLVQGENPIAINGDDTICFNTTTRLSINGNFNRILWSTGDTTQSINVGAGTYTVDVEDVHGCPNSGSITVIEGVNLGFTLRDDTITIQEGESEMVRLMTMNTAGITFNWDPAEFLDCATCTDVTITPNEPVTYTITARETLTGCTFNRTLHVQVDTLFETIFLPNIFTPNGDGENDEFRLFGLLGNNIRYKVYNRWNVLVFESLESDDAWDGSMFGRGPAQTGRYTVVIEVLDDDDNTIDTRVHLLRLQR